MKKSYSITSHDHHPRQVALEILSKLEKEGVHADQLLDHYFRAKTPLSSREKAFTTELVYGVLRWRDSIDWVIDQFSTSPHRRVSRQVRNLLRLGIYQVLYLDNISIPAAVYATVDLAKSFFNEKIASMVNGVLRNVERNRNRIQYPSLREEPITAIAVQYSHPAWLVKHWIQHYGIAETIALCKANNTPPPFTIRTNTLRIGRNKLIEHFQKESLACDLSPYSPEGIVLYQPADITRLSSFQKGWFMVQDEAAQLISHLLAPKPREDTLDLCAAPGGKTTHVAQLMKNQGRIVAVDVRPDKIALLKENLSRLGINIIKPLVADASDSLPLRNKEGFDNVLLDVPCSGLGILRRHPEGKWVKSLQTITKLVKNQFVLIENAARHVKAGGTMVYSTCTLNAQENEHLVETFLSGARDTFQIENPLPYLPSRVQGFVDKQGYLKTVPHRGFMDGFFGVRLRRIR